MIINHLRTLIQKLISPYNEQFVKQTCKEGDNGELGGMVSMDHQILETQIKRNMGQLLRRICILILKFKGLVCLFDPESLG